MAKDDPTITKDALSELIALAVRAELAKTLTSKTPDERLTEEMNRQRGRDRPSPFTDVLIPCVSPITGARFIARLVTSRSDPRGRVVEMQDYVRPDGWDVPKSRGGLVPEGTEMKDLQGNPSKAFTGLVYKTYWQKDWIEIQGRPLPNGWRADVQAPPGSVTLTPEQMDKLGIKPEDIQAALSEKAAE